MGYFAIKNSGIKQTKVKYKAPTVVSLVKIVSIEKKQIGDQELNFLILQVIESDITVMIPEGSVQARGLRPVAKKNELKKGVGCL